MKIFSTIFVTYIFLLTTAPSVAMVVSSFTENCNSNCCSKKQQPNKPAQEQEGCCNNGAVNPFMSCCNGSALTANQHFFPSLVSTNQKFRALTENLNSVFLADAWHPPKTV